jgi:hypothetical protein
VVNAGGPLLVSNLDLFPADVTNGFAPMPVYNEPHGKVIFKDHLGVVPRDAPMMILAGSVMHVHFYPLCFRHRLVFVPTLWRCVKKARNLPPICLFCVIDAQQLKWSDEEREWLRERYGIATTLLLAN